jgi:hypothetical protein
MSHRCSTYPLLHELTLKFLLRFGNTLSLADRVKALQALHQKGSEGSEDFYDRVSAGLYSLEQESIL